MLAQRGKAQRRKELPTHKYSMHVLGPYIDMYFVHTYCMLVQRISLSHAKCSLGGSWVIKVTSLRQGACSLVGLCIAEVHRIGANGNVHACPCTVRTGPCKSTVSFTRPSCKQAAAHGCATKSVCGVAQSMFGIYCNATNPRQRRPLCVQLVGRREPRVRRVSPASTFSSFKITHVLSLSGPKPLSEPGLLYVCMCVCMLHVDSNSVKHDLYVRT